MRSLWFECRRVVRSSDYGRVQYRHAQATDILLVSTPLYVCDLCMLILYMAVVTRPHYPPALKPEISLQVIMHYNL
jgi:hypothetical protein